MASTGGSFAIPLPPVRFDGTNFREWAVHLRIHLNSQRLWGHLTGEQPCPPRPTLPALPALSAGAAGAAQEVNNAALEEALELYQSEIHAYERWQEASKHEVLQMKTMSASQCSNQVKQKITPPQLKLFPEPTSNVALIPTDPLTDSTLSNCVDNVPLSRDFPINGGQVRHGYEGSYLHAENNKEDSSQKSQNTSSNQATRGKDESFHEPSEETTVAIPAIPLTLYMPVMRNAPGASADGPYKLLTAPIEAVPISYRPAEPIRQPHRSFCNLGPLPGVLSEPNKRGNGPNPMVHATALACGARVVPLEEAASLIKAIESKIRSGGATIAKLHSSNLAPLVPEAVSMSSSSEDDEEDDHSEPLMPNVERNCHDKSSEEMKLQGEPSELETEAENCSAQPENENLDPADC